MKTFLVLMSTFLIINLSFGQKGIDKPTLKQFKFGKYWVLENDDQRIFDSSYSKSGIVTNESIYFEGATIDNSKLVAILQALELKQCSFIRDSFPSLWLDSFEVFPDMSIYECSLGGKVRINKVLFHKGALFQNCRFNCLFNLIDSSTFKGRVSFSCTTKMSPLAIKNSIFTEEVEMEYITFDSPLECYNDNFKNGISFSKSVFDTSTNFTEVKFSTHTDFSFSTFKVQPEFVRASFVDTVNFFNSNFKYGVDLRRCNFDSVHVLFLEKMEYPIGKLFLYWDQFKGYKQPRIQLHYYSPTPEDNFKRYEVIYKKLRDNFIAQGDKASADDVMYELAWQKELTIGTCLQKLYGIFLGYGYKPWKFLFLIILPLLIFARALAWWFYPIVVCILNDKKKETELLPNRSRKIGCKFLRIKVQDNRPYGIPCIVRLWHVIHFSASVLLGVRFKKEWIHISNSNFLILITIEWLLGIAFYIIFILFVKSTEFGYIKGLFGF
jgi:hypothetical protein